ncbi:MAG: hypothetical protein IPM24_10335 [Bryobacterales bacterium]|nr:hypothetical protein [Bryobacterales bacterium]
MMVWLVAVLLLMPAAADAQRRPARPKPRPAAGPAQFPIVEIAVEDNKRYPADRIIAAAGLKRGDPGEKAAFDAARDRLLATGHFEQVGYRYEPSADGRGYKVVFEVQEAEPAYPVRFDPLGVEEEELVAWIRARHPLFDNEIPATDVLLKRYTASVEEFLESKGAPGKIVARVVAERPDELEILFRSAAGDPAVAEIVFEGSRVLSNEKLLDLFAGIAYGSPFREPLFRQRLDRGVRPHYEKLGYLDVRFEDLRAEPAKDGVRGVIVHVRVAEGEPFTLGDVALDGFSPVAPADLLREGRFQSGETANMEEAAAGVERMRRALRRSGYMNAKLDIQRKLDAEKLTVDLTVVLESGDRFDFGKLEIVGLDINGEAAIKKLWLPKPGQPFNADYPDFFLSRVQEDGIFEALGKTSAELKINEAEKKVDVVLYFGAVPPPPKPKRRF